jgi:hypothetical protein
MNAENFQFYIWYRGYTARFTELPTDQKSLSPEWTKGRSSYRIYPGVDFEISRSSKSREQSKGSLPIAQKKKLALLESWDAECGTTIVEKPEYDKEAMELLESVNSTAPSSTCNLPFFGSLCPCAVPRALT